MPGLQPGPEVGFELFDERHQLPKLVFRHGAGRVVGCAMALSAPGIERRYDTRVDTDGQRERLDRHRMVTRQIGARTITGRM